MRTFVAFAEGVVEIVSIAAFIATLIGGLAFAAGSLPL